MENLGRKPQHNAGCEDAFDGLEGTRSGPSKQGISGTKAQYVRR